MQLSMFVPAHKNISTCHLLFCFLKGIRGGPYLFQINYHNKNLLLIYELLIKASFRELHCAVWTRNSLKSNMNGRRRRGH